MGDRKLCPLRKAKIDDDNESEFFLECEEEKCAWWLSGRPKLLRPEPGRCAILELGYNSRFK
jgi:hypothetical protein